MNIPANVRNGQRPMWFDPGVASMRSGRTCVDVHAVRYGVGTIRGQPVPGAR